MKKSDFLTRGILATHRTDPAFRSKWCLGEKKPWLSADPFLIIQVGWPAVVQHRKADSRHPGLFTGNAGDPAENVDLAKNFPAR